MKIIRLTYEGSYFSIMNNSKKIRNNLNVNINEISTQILVNPKDGNLCNH